MNKFFFLLSFTILLPNSNHLVFSRITILPDTAELITIKNPTEDAIDLENYYISDSNEYYKIQTEGDLSPSNPITGFLVKFPAIILESSDSINIAIHSGYESYYESTIEVDFILND